MRVHEELHFRSLKRRPYHEASITTRVHSRLVLPQVKAEHGTSRHALHPEFRVPLSPPQRHNEPVTGARDAGIVAIYLKLVQGGWVVSKREHLTKFLQQQFTKKYENNSTNSSKLGDENFDCVLTTTQLKSPYTLKRNG